MKITKLSKIYFASDLIRDSHLTGLIERSPNAWLSQAAGDLPCILLNPPALYFILLSHCFRDEESKVRRWLSPFYIVANRTIRSGPVRNSVLS